MILSFLLKSVIWLALIYLGICIVMFAKQRKLQYHPDNERVAPASFGLRAIEDIDLKTADGETIHGWYAHPQNTGKPVILYFHGNADAVQARWERAKLFTDQGYGLLMVSYRGFAGSTGSPTEEGLIQDADAAYAYLGSQGFSARQLVYWGESLGSGVAIQLAARHAPAALILESPFTSAADVAREIYWFLPIGLLMKDQFKSIDYIGSIKAPVFIMHGDQDHIVPYKMGQEMFAAANEPKEFYPLPGGGHVDPLTLPLWGVIDSFIARHRPR